MACLAFSFRLVVGLLGVLFLSMPALTAAVHDEFRFVGTLVKVDAPRNVASVKFREEGKDLTVEVKLTASTVITRDDKKITKSDLKAGLNVVVDALGDDYDDLEALAIKVVPPPSR